MSTAIVSTSLEKFFELIDHHAQATRGLHLEGQRAETKKLKKKYCDYDLFVSIFSVYLGNSSIISADIVLL